MDPSVYFARRRPSAAPHGDIFLNSFRRLSISYVHPARWYSAEELERLISPTTLDKFSDDLQVTILSNLRARDIQNLCLTSCAYRKQLTAKLIETIAGVVYKKKLECFVAPAIKSLHLLEWYHERGQVVNTGSIHSIVVQDGCAWGFGANGNGQLGINSTQSFGIPMQIQCRRVAMVACGDSHTVLLCWDSSLYSFGRGKYGALGHGTDTDIFYPKQISFFAKLEGFGAPRMIAAGQDHTLVVSNGLYGFGWNDFHQLGGISTEWKLSPELVSAKCFTDVDGGLGHTIGLEKDAVWSLGLNTYGQLGLGHRNGVTEFASVQLPNDVSPFECAKSSDELMHDVDMTSNSIRIQRISCGMFHNLLLTVHGSVYSFGHGAQGKLGQGDTEDRLAPCKVEGFIDRVMHVKAGMAHSLCIDSGYRLYAFGMGRRGQLGIEEKACVAFPKVVRSNVIEVSGGGYHSLFRTLDGTIDTVEACGRATRGQLGIGEEFQQEGDHSRPVRIQCFCKRRRIR